MSGPAFWCCISGWLVALAILLWHHRDTIGDRLAGPPAAPARRQVGGTRSHVRLVKNPDSA